MRSFESKSARTLDDDFEMWTKRAKAFLPDAEKGLDRDRWYMLRDAFLFFDGDDSGSIEVNEFEFFVVALDDELGAGSGEVSNPEISRLRVQLHDLQDQVSDLIKIAEEDAQDEETALQVLQEALDIKMNIQVLKYASVKMQLVQIDFKLLS